MSDSVAVKIIQLEVQTDLTLCHLLRRQRLPSSVGPVRMSGEAAWHSAFVRFAGGETGARKPTSRALRFEPRAHPIGHAKRDVPGRHAPVTGSHS